MRLFIQSTLIILLTVNVFPQSKDVLSQSKDVLSPSNEDVTPSFVVEKAKRIDNPAVLKFMTLLKDEEVMATVDNVPVRYFDIKFWYKNMLENQLHLYPELPLTDEVAKTCRKACLEKGILKQIMDAEILRLGLIPSEEEVDKELKKYKALYYSELEFENYLAGNGVSLEKFRKEFKFQMAICNLMKYFMKSAVMPTKRDLKKWYKANKAQFFVPRKIRFSIILFKNDDDNPSRLKANVELMTKIRADIVSGKNTFEFYAKNYSDDPSRKNNGDMGMLPVNALKEYFVPLKTFPKNKLTPIYSFKEGLLLAKITEEIPERTEKFKTVRDQINKMLTDKAIIENHEKCIEILKKKAVIKILDPSMQDLKKPDDKQP